MKPSSTATERSDLLLHAYLDGELDVSASVDVERIIASDTVVANNANSIVALQKVLREKVPRERIPPELKSRIEAAIGRRPARRRPTWMLMAASVVAAIALSSTSTWIALQVPPSSTALANELVDSHMRSLAASQPTDVVSSDRHIVKPWFNGRISVVAARCGSGVRRISARRRPYRCGQQGCCPNIGLQPTSPHHKPYRHFLAQGRSSSRFNWAC